MNKNINLLILALFVAIASAQDLATSGYVVQTYYQDNTCSFFLKNVTSLVNVCATGFSIAAYYTDSRAMPISIINGCTAGSTISNFTENICMISGALSFTYTYVTTLPNVATGLKTYTQYDTTVSGCQTLWAVTQQAPVCFRNDYGDFRSQSIVCEGTTRFTTTTCTDFNCSVGCTVDRNTIQNTCDTNQHTYSTCSAAPAGTSSTTGSGTTTGNADTTTGNDDGGSTTTGGNDDGGSTTTGAGNGGSTTGGSTNGGTNAGSTTTSVSTNGRLTSSSDKLAASILLVAGVAAVFAL